MIHFLWLLPFSFLAFWQMPEIESWPEAWRALLIYSPYAIAGLGLFIAFWLNRIQPVLILLTLILLNVGLSYFFGSERMGLTAQALYPVLSLLLPLNLFVWMLFPEKGLKNKFYVLSLFSLFFLQVLFLFWYVETLPLDFIDYLAQPIPTKLTWLQMPMIPFLVSLFVALVLVIKNAMSAHVKVLDTTIVFVLILMVVGLNAFEVYGVLAWMSSIASIMLVLSIIFDAHDIAYTDELTNLKGRRALFEAFSGLGRKYSIAMMDIDHFKKFNDTYGHDVGDEVLRTVAQELANVKYGAVFRYGGEEFTLLFKGKTPEEAKPFIEEVRVSIANRILKVSLKNKPTTTKVTVSFGVAEKTKELNKPEAVLKAADDALYQAKAAGRNCTAIAGEKSVKKKAKRIKAT